MRGMFFSVLSFVQHALCAIVHAYTFFASPPSALFLQSLLYIFIYFNPGSLVRGKKRRIRPT